MPIRGTVSILLARRVIMAAAMRGADPRALAAVVQLPDAADDPNLRLPQAALVALWAEAERQTNDADFGLHCAELSQRAPANALAFAVATSPSLLHALDCIARYVRLVHDGLRVRVSTGPERVRVQLEVDAELSHRHGVEFALALVTLLAREQIGPRFVLDEVAFAHERPPRGCSEHTRVFGRIPRFTAMTNEISFERALLDAPFGQHDPLLHAHLGRYLDRVAAELDTASDLRARAQRIVIEQLRGGAPDVEEVARRLRLGARTLQRRLRDEGTSFQSVVSDARREVALSYLGDRALSLGEVAFLLGYTNPSNFHRAFKRWTGTTPAEARRRALDASTR